MTYGETLYSYSIDDWIGKFRSRSKAKDTNVYIQKNFKLYIGNICLRLSVFYILIQGSKLPGRKESGSAPGIPSDFDRQVVKNYNEDGSPGRGLAEWTAVFSIGLSGARNGSAEGTKCQDPFRPFSGDFRFSVDGMPSVCHRAWIF